MKRRLGLPVDRGRRRRRVTGRRRRWGHGIDGGRRHAGCGGAARRQHHETRDQRSKRASWPTHKVIVSRPTDGWPVGHHPTSGTGTAPRARHRFPYPAVIFDGSGRNSSTLETLEPGRECTASLCTFSSTASSIHWARVLRETTAATFARWYTSSFIRIVLADLLVVWFMS